MSAVDGFVADGFERVADVLAASLDSEIGLNASACLDGELVLDAWCGWADPDAGIPWSKDTLAVMYSSTKGLASLCAQMLVDRGLLDVDAPVAEYWPEFAANGKADARVRHILNHSVGVLTVPRYWELVGADGRGFERDVEIEERMAAAPPVWPPGTSAGYHALTFGWLVGGLVRRIDGRSIGRFFHEEVARPLGLSMWIGLPEELHHRVAPVLPGDPGPVDDEARAAYDAAVAKARVELAEGRLDSLEAQWVGSFFMPPSFEDPGVFLREIMNKPWVRSAEMAGGNGIGNAHGLARMYAALSLGGSLDGVRLVGPESVELFDTPQPLPDGTPTGYCMGYALFEPALTGGGTARGFGHSGAGGSIGFADRERGLGFGLVKNKLQPDPSTAERVVRALYEVVG